MLGRQGPALALLLLVACADRRRGARGRRPRRSRSPSPDAGGPSSSPRCAAVGVQRRPLLRSCIGEQLILLGTGFALGLPAGVVAARLALPAIPEYSDHDPGAAGLRTARRGVVAFAVVVGLVLVVTAWVAGRALMRSAVPTRLREAAQ